MRFSLFGLFTYLISPNFANAKESIKVRIIIALQKMQDI